MTFVRSPPSVSIGLISMPGVSIGTTNIVSPRCLGTSGFVRVSRSSTYADSWAIVVNIFWPLMIQSSPSRTARVRCRRDVGAGIGLRVAEARRAPRRPGAAGGSRGAADRSRRGRSSGRRARPSPAVHRGVDPGQLVGHLGNLERVEAEAAMVRRPRRGQPAPLRERPVQPPVVDRAARPHPLDQLGRAVLGDEGAHLGPEPGGALLVGDPPAGGLEPVGDAGELGRGIAGGERPRLGPAEEELHVVLEHEAVAAVEVQRGRGDGFGRPRPRTRRPSAPAAPAGRRPRARRARSRAPPSAVATSASLCWMLWNEPIGTPNWWRALAYSTPRSRAPWASPTSAAAVSTRHSSSAGGEGAVRIGSGREYRPLDRLARQLAVGHRGRAEVRR